MPFKHPYFKDSITKCYCHSCKKDTNHKILAEVTDISNDPEYGWTKTLCIVECCGCSYKHFMEATQEESIIGYDENGNTFYPYVEKVYPDKGTVEQISDIYSIPADIRRIYKETIQAINSDCLLLAAAGFRATIEAICLEKQIEGKQLETKINNLCKKGIITHNDRDRLHSIRFMGNDSVHAIKEPNKAAVLLVLKIIHNMRNNLYVLTEECNGILKGPISTFEEFKTLLNEGISNRNIGDIDTLKNLLPRNRRLIKDDLSSFETELKSAIQQGTYTHLSLCPAPQGNHPQQYKIEKLNDSVAP